MLSTLTARQKECIRGVASRKTLKRVGIDLGISRQTVRFHLKRASLKLNRPNSIAQWTDLALKLGLVTRHASNIRENKLLLVDAHRRGDQEAMRILSQQKEALKKKPTCLDCGVPVSPSRHGKGLRSVRCAMHYRAHRWRNRLSV